MGLHDRPYWRDDAAPTGGGGGGGMMRGISSGFPKPSKAVKWLLIINAVAFLLQLALAGNQHVHLTPWFGATTNEFWQVWRYLTFQFLHDTEGFWHIAMNMLGLYMFGTQLEKLLGSRRFLRFYLSCGAAAGLLYVLVGAIPQLGLKPGEHSGNFWSQVAHLGGAGMAAVWLWVIPRFGGAAQGIVRRANRGAWQRKMQRRQAEQADIDRILDKIRVEGLASLTRKEKNTLKQATLRQQREERDISRL